jgi:hypothetical protein
MRRPLDLLNDIHIAEPCTFDWEQMSGDDRQRHCSKCENPVHDLSTMSADEANALLRSAQAPCVRILRREDNSIVTADSRRGFARRLVLIAASWFGFVVLSGCRDATRSQQQLMGKPARDPGGRQELGKIAMPEERPVVPLPSPGE